jgi:transcriptional regulator with XRE-family HTH domain
MAKGKRWRRTFLREWRLHRKKDQDDLAEAMGISGPYLSQIEDGLRRYNQDILEAAARELRTTTTAILSRRPPLARTRSHLSGRHLTPVIATAPLTS